MSHNANIFDDMTVILLLFTAQAVDTIHVFLEVKTLSKRDDFTEHLTAARTVCAAMMFQNAKTLLRHRRQALPWPDDASREPVF